MLLSGTLRRRNKIWHVVISYVNKFTKKRKWIERTTGTTNKREAESLLQLARIKYTKDLRNCWKKGLSDLNEYEKLKEIPFLEYYKKWLYTIEKNQLEESSFVEYVKVFNRSLKPYFENLQITLQGLTAKNIQDFYTNEITTKKMSSNTIRKINANINKCLKYAYFNDRLIDENPIKFIQLPKKEQYIGTTLTKDELQKLLDSTKGDKIWLGIFLAGVYGLSRSEIVGLKWKNIDFENEVFTIGSTITKSYKNGKLVLIKKDRAKNKSRCRTLPIITELKKYFLKLKKEQEYYRFRYRESYKIKNIDYVYLDPDGTLVNPDYFTQKLPKILKKLDIKKIRFHDLRHTCTSILHYYGVNIKSLQAWLGHSNPMTTINTYAHLLNDIQLENKDLLEKLYSKKIKNK